MTDMPTALALVVAAIFAVRGLMSLGRRGGSPGRRMRVVESCGLGPRARLHLVEVEGERLLVAVGEGGTSLLRSLPPHDPEPTSERTRSETGRRASAPLRAWVPRIGSAVRGAVSGLGVVVLALLASGLVASPAGAETAAGGLVDGLSSVLDLDRSTDPDRLANTLEIVALMTVISIAPSLLLMATCFTRIVIVLSLLRQAIGIHQLPPNQVIIGLALFVTMSVMAPVGQRMHDEAFEPYVEREIDASTALERGLGPAREYMLAHTREKDVALFYSFSQGAGGESEVTPDPTTLPLSVLLPSYMLSELRVSFEIGFMVFLPFLMIDLVVASVLISMGMIVLPPIVVSLPFKLMLFVLVDGWNLVVGSLVRGLV